MGVDDGRGSRTDILQQLDPHRGVRAVVVDLAEALASQVAGPDRGTAGDGVATHDRLFAVLQEEFCLGHVAGSVDDIYDLSATDRALDRFAGLIDDSCMYGHCQLCLRLCVMGIKGKG